MGKTIVFPPKIEAELKKRKIKTLFVKSLRSKDCEFTYRSKERKAKYEKALEEENFEMVIFHAFDWNKSERKFNLMFGFWGSIINK